MQQWMDAVRKELGISVEFEVNTILDLARDAAHGVERRAAPVTTFLLGFAVAQGADAEDAAAKIALLASNWPAKE
jgi:hydrogenase/urease accessory protein HupE